MYAGEGCSLPQVRPCGVGGGWVSGDAAEAGRTGLRGHGARTRGGVEGVPETE